MATLVFFHAHPDDETLSTGGTMALASLRGHRVVLVTATLGRRSGAAEGAGGLVAVRRARELRSAAALLGVRRIEYLGYRDSGRGPGAPDPGGFATADHDEAAARLAEVLRQESPDGVVVYDRSGQYGHPDHVAASAVGHRAAELADVPVVYEASFSRERVQALVRRLPGGGRLAAAVGQDPEAVGLPQRCFTVRVDVTDVRAVKLAALACHRSQHGRLLAAAAWALPAWFDQVVAAEWFIRRSRVPDGPAPLEGLAASARAVAVG